MSRRIIIALAAACVAFLLPCATSAQSNPAPSAPSLAGKWTLLPDRSTDLTPWKTLDIVIAIDGPRVTIKDRFAAGSRAIDTLAILDLSREVSIVPVPWWTDNRHIGAYIGGDRTERVRSTWLDGGRVFRTDAELMLDTQQGSHPVSIRTDYRLSPRGDELVLVQLRSSREIPIVYIFKRASP